MMADEPLPLFRVLDAKLGERLKRRGLDAVEAHAAEGFSQDAQLAVQTVARRRIELTSDDVWVQLALTPHAATHDHRALGAVMRAAQRSGWITPTERFVQSDQPLRHRAPIRVWRSLLL
jgi:hypothetical protein